MKLCLQSLLPKTLTKTLFSTIGEAKQSYYQILGVPKTATKKQLRKQFLRRARQLHPDHNPQPEALERFKLIKEAYSVLKDPQKRYIYDSGITSEGVDPSAYNPVPQSPSHKYYENKWHGFTKNNYPDQRDEYDEEKVLYSQDINEVYSRPGYRLMAIAILGAAVVGYGYLGWRRSRAEIELEHSRGILEATVDDKQSRRMKRYIEERAKANRVQE